MIRIKQWLFCYLQSIWTLVAHTLETTGWLACSNGGEVQSSVPVTSTMDWGSLRRSKKKEEEKSLLNRCVDPQTQNFRPCDEEKRIYRRQLAAQHTGSIQTWRSHGLSLCAFSPLEESKASGRGYLLERFVMSQRAEKVMWYDDDDGLFLSKRPIFCLCCKIQRRRRG